MSVRLLSSHSAKALSFPLLQASQTLAFAFIAVALVTMVVREEDPINRLIQRDDEFDGFALHTLSLDRLAGQCSENQVGSCINGVFLIHLNPPGTFMCEWTIVTALSGDSGKEAAVVNYQRNSN